MNKSATSVTPGILGLNALDARNQHLLALDSPKNLIGINLPCGLPAELWNIIMDCLHDDKDSLRSCLLACRSWGHFCRHHVFGTFTWNALDHDSDTKIDFESESNLFHPCPQYVRHLAINGYGYGSGSFITINDDDSIPEDWDRDMNTVHVDDGWLLPLAERLDDFVSVVHLEVDSVDWADMFGTHAWDTFSSSTKFLSQIRSVDFSNIPLQPFQYLLDSICLFPALERLDYLPSHVDLDCDEVEGVDYKSYAPPSSWNAFSTAHAPLQLPTSGFWTWLSAVGFTSLQTIRLDSVPTLDLPLLSRYLCLLGGSLKDFRIRFVKPRDIYDFVESAALVNSTGLEHLEIIGLVRQNCNGQIWMGEESLSLLSVVHGAALSSLDIILDDHSWNTVPSQTSALDKLLTTTSMFPSLKRVHITCGWGVEIRKAFVECEEQGLLTITTLTPDYSMLATMTALAYRE